MNLTVEQIENIVAKGIDVASFHNWREQLKEDLKHLSLKNLSNDKIRC
jgi:hypothetical protein